MAASNNARARPLQVCMLWCMCLASAVVAETEPSPECVPAPGNSCPTKRGKDSGVLLMQLKPKLHKAPPDAGNQAQVQEKQSCCSRCGERGWCSPTSGKCHPLQDQLDYEPCEAHPRDQVLLGPLDWADEFDGVAIDKSGWALLEGSAHPSLQMDTGRRENAFVDNGTLKIVAKCEDQGEHQYSSARLSTQNIRDWGPGHRVEVRARAPTGRGAWPAIWMLPSQGLHGAWPKSGEIDLVEMTGCTGGKVQGAVHTSAFNQANKSQKGHHFYTDFSGWHTYTLDWVQGRMKWYVDGVNFFTFAPEDSSNTAQWPFNEKFFLNMNVGVGGPWAGFCLRSGPSCSKQEEFGRDQVMEIDYVRVYKLAQDPEA